MRIRRRLVAGLVLVVAACSSNTTTRGSTSTTPSNGSAVVTGTSGTAAVNATTVVAASTVATVATTTEPLVAASTTLTAPPTPAATATEPLTVDATDPTSPAATAVPASCGTDDLGAGLVVSVPCDGTPGSVEAGATASPGSVLTLPDPSFPELENVDVTARQAPTTDGRLVTIYIFGSDTLFDSGAATLRSTADPALVGALASIRTRFGSPPLLVMGHTDSAGSAADNQSLSNQRAAAVAAFLVANGASATQITTVGLASTVPAALEIDDSGAVNELGRQLNRRVELVVVAPG